MCDSDEVYDAHGIEITVKHLCQHVGSPRGGFYDADVIRCGEPNDLKQFLEKLSHVIKERISPILQTDEERESLDIATKRICRAKLRITQQEREDYHWLVVGGLVEIINILLQRESARQEKCG